MALNVNNLETDIYNALKNHLPDVISKSISTSHDMPTDEVEKISNKIGNNLADMLEGFAGELASAIYRFVSGAAISGTIQTAGSPAAQTSICIDGAKLPSGQPVPATPGQTNLKLT